MNLRETLTALADALREGADYPHPMTLDEMPYWARECHFQGKLQGRTEGYTEGYGAGRTKGDQEGYDRGLAEGKAFTYDVGYSEGKQAERTALWNGIQKNGTRTNYYFGFANAWDKETFKPEHSVIVSVGTTVANNMFQNFNDGLSEEEIESKSVDLVEVAEQQGIEFNFTNAKQLMQTFQTGGIKRIGVVDASNKTSMLYTFDQKAPYSLSRIEKIISSETTAWDGSLAFRNCRNLTHCIFEGVIAKSLDMSPCTKLDKESITSIFNSLAVITSSDNHPTLTLSLTAVDKAFETSEGANDGHWSEEWDLLFSDIVGWSFSIR